jgi:hypothetical protein
MKTEIAHQVHSYVAPNQILFTIFIVQANQLNDQ